MKKRMLSLLLTLILCVGVIPTMTAFAETTIHQLDLVIPLPEAGMTRAEYENSLVLQAAHTECGDLVAMGVLSKINLSVVNGDFDVSDRSNQKYIAGNTYQIVVKPIFMNSGYSLPYDADFAVIPSQCTITVNKVAASITQFSGPGAPGIAFQYTIPAPQLSAEEQAAVDAQKKAESDARHTDLRKIIANPYTVSEADSYWIGKNESDVVTITGDIKDFNWNDVFGNSPLVNPNFVTKLIFDVTSDDSAYDKRLGARFVTRLPNLKEIWLGEGVDPVEFYNGIMSEEALGINPISQAVGYKVSGLAFGEGDATLYIQSSRLDKAGAMAAFSNSWPSFPFTIKLYDGDVLTAQKTNSAYEWCTEHNYIIPIDARDRIYRYADCYNGADGAYVYFSCEHCGKCEYNPDHIYKLRDKESCRFYAMTASDEAYIGQDTYGNHLFWYSCMYCGRTRKEIEANPTVDDWKLSGNELSYEQYKESCQNNIANREQNALISTDWQIGMFSLSDKTTAKVSSWAQDGVNQALDNNLIDTSLMGSDYTQPISRLQFCSVAVKLAEELTGKSINPASVTTFADTDNTYVLKAYAAGITSGTSDTKFSPEITLDRQQMATFIYRTMQYIKANSDIKYTPYTSKLANYTDNSQIADWAKEPLAFMNALDLIKGTSDITISPTDKCTIEQALTVASRSIYADHIGWYQVKSAEENPNLYGGDGNEKYWAAPNYGADFAVTCLMNDKRIWVTGRRIKGDYSYVTTPDPYTGQIFFVLAEWLRPIRE